jgi:hypothetical protein
MMDETKSIEMGGWQVFVISKPSGVYSGTSYPRCEYARLKFNLSKLSTAFLSGVCYRLRSDLRTSFARTPDIEPGAHGYHTGLR